jgi:large subunit ribosomal protein L28
MSYKCVICGKQEVSGNKVSHSNRHTRTKWLPNLQTIKIVLKGVTKRAKVCTQCIKSKKITKPAPRTWKKPETK